MELKKYGELLEKADGLGLQLMTESTPGDIKNIQEMIDEYQILWKDINTRIEKLKLTCVQETACRKKVKFENYSTSSINCYIYVFNLLYYILRIAGGK